MRNRNRRARPIARQKENFYSFTGAPMMYLTARSGDAMRCRRAVKILSERGLCSSFALA
jgi:hypothetical protein